MAKKLNKEATIQVIMDKANRSIGVSINVEKFNAKMKTPEANDFLVEACQFLHIEPVYI